MDIYARKCMSCAQTVKSNYLSAGGRAFRASMEVEVTLLLLYHVCFCAIGCCTHVVLGKLREKEQKRKERKINHSLPTNPSASI